MPPAAMPLAPAPARLFALRLLPAPAALIAIGWHAGAISLAIADFRLRQCCLPLMPPLFRCFSFFACR